MNPLIARKRVLVVDDETDLRTLIRISLGEDYDVYEAGDGLQALSLAEATRPDAILLDVYLPKTNGFVVCRTLKSHPLLSKAPIIMVSQREGKAAPSQGLEHGADYFLPKPFTPQALRILLNIACGAADACGDEAIPLAPCPTRRLLDGLKRHERLGRLEDQPQKGHRGPLTNP